jgi:hypothetical protein
LIQINYTTEATQFLAKVADALIQRDRSKSESPDVCHDASDLLIA